MADGLFGGAYTGNPNIQRQGARARALAQQRDVNTLPDPRTYAAVSGLFGTPPDQMGFSVLNPQYESIMRVAEPAFAAGTALGVAPMVGLGARLAGRTLGPTAARMTEGYMQRQGMMPSLDVYHGTPYRLQSTTSNPLGEFDASKIGSGAGAQNYGYGIYSSEAAQYADMFAIRKSLPDIEGIAFQNGLQLSPDARVELIRQATRDSAGKPAKSANYANPEAVVKKLQNANIEARQMPPDKLQKTIKEFQEQNSAYLYKADLPDKMIPKMLDWDKPLSQQSPEVQVALKGIEAKFPEILDFNLRNWMNTDPLASTFHNVLNRDLGVNPAIIASTLKEQGIPGIVYKDAGIRNFVTFPGEEQNLRILQRNAEVASPMYTDPFGNTIADTTR